jgi:hypothetical protein
VRLRYGCKPVGRQPTAWCVHTGHGRPICIRPLVVLAWPTAVAMHMLRRVASRTKRQERLCWARRAGAGYFRSAGAYQRLARGVCGLTQCIGSQRRPPRERFTVVADCRESVCFGLARIFIEPLCPSSHSTTATTGSTGRVHTKSTTPPSRASTRIVEARTSKRYLG